MLSVCAVDGGRHHSFTFCAGEIMPDVGNGYICGHSMQQDMARARQLVGYCPQFDALPGTLTGLHSLLMHQP